MMRFSWFFFPLIQPLSAQQNAVGFFASRSTSSHSLPFILPCVGLSSNCSLLILIVNSPLTEFPVQSLCTSTIMQRLLLSLVLRENPSPFFHKAPKMGLFYGFSIQVLITDIQSLRGTFNTDDFWHRNLGLFLVYFSVNKESCASAHGGASWD